MAFVERIAVVIDSAHQGAVRGLNETGLAAGELGKKTTSARAAIALLDRTGLSAAGSMGKLRKAIVETGSVTKGLEKSGIGVSKALGVGVAGGALAAGAAIAAFALHGVSEFVSLTAEVRAFQRVSGESAQDASKMVAITKVLGLESSTAARGVGMLAKNIGTGKLVLSDYGLQTKRTAQGNVDMAATVADVAEKYQSIEDPTKRAAFAQAAYGKSWQQLTPLLGKSREELKKITDDAQARGLIFKQEDLDKGRELGRATKELGEAATGLSISLGEELVPAISFVVGGLTDFVDGIKPALQWVGDLGSGVSDLAHEIRSHLSAGMAEDEANFRNAVSAKAVWDAEKKRADAMLESINAAKSLTMGMGGLTQATENYVGVALGAEGADRAAAAQIRDVTVATMEAAAAKGTDAVAANQKLSDANFALEEAINRAAEAHKAQAIAAAAGTTEEHQAQVGLEAYRDTLNFYANSTSPAAVAATQALKDKLNELTPPPPIPLTIDASQAHAELARLNMAIAGSVAKAAAGIKLNLFGVPVGPRT